MFSRKEIIKFSEAALVSVHCNCLIVRIVIMREYWSGNTANATVDICLLVENDNKKTETKCLFTLFFISHLAALRPTLGHWQGGSLTHSMLITTLSQSQPKIHWEPPNEVESQSLTKRISGIWTGNLAFLSVTRYLTVSLSPKLYQKQLAIVLLVSFQGIIGLFH